jgi:hypothetical protein
MTGILPDDPQRLSEAFNRPAAPASAPSELADVFDAFEAKTAEKAKAAEVEQDAEAARHILLEELEAGGFDEWIARECERAKPSPSTERQYRKDMRRYVAWCDAVGVPACPAPPEVPALYLRELANAGASMPVLRRALCAITRLHDIRSPSPTKSVLVRAVMRYAAARQPATSAETEH